MATIVGVFSFAWLLPEMDKRLEFKIAKRVDSAVEDAAGEDFVVEKKPWQPFTAKKLQWLQEQGKTVLVDFTADWCAVCKSNEAFVLKTKETEKVLNKHNVYTLVADWTARGDAEEVTAELQRLGFKNVPVVAIYPGNKPNEPIKIPGTYTSGQLHDHIREAAHASGGGSPSPRVAERQGN